jgi:hypothetical protein
MPLLNKLAAFARSPQGRKIAQQAMRYANSPQGKAKIGQAREALAKRGRGRPPR